MGYTKRVLLGITKITQIIIPDQMKKKNVSRPHPHRFFKILKYFCYCSYLLQTLFVKLL